jgi:hypothetical protein
MMTIIGIAGCADGFLPHTGPVLRKLTAHDDRFALNACAAIEQAFGDFQSVRMHKINPSDSGPWN